MLHLVNQEDETRHGLASLFYIKCSCGNIVAVYTSHHHGNVDVKEKNMYNVSPLEGTVKFYLLDCEPLEVIYSSCFCRSVYLFTYRNDSNNRPRHLINLSFFFLALIRFHIKFGDDRKDNLKKESTLSQLLSRFRFPVTHTLMQFLALALKNSIYFSTVFLKILQHSNKHLIKLCEVYLGA